MSELTPEFSGALAPERERMLQAGPLRLCLHEWGDPDAEPLLLCHGMWDHARGFDALAPQLAQRYRVIALDARGHGDSSWADAYLWQDDVNDIRLVLHAIGRPCHLVGHSKGGAQATDAAAAPDAPVRKIVNIDGFGPPKDEPRRPGTPEALPAQFAQYLDRRRSERAYRPAGSLDELIERRRRANTRLSESWLRYFVFHGARRAGDGWTWKSDPRLGTGFGPFEADWIAPGWQRVRAAMLAVTGTEPDFFGPASDALLDERLAFVPNAERARVQGTGHFVHMEQPEQTARLILDFLAG